MTYSTVKGNFIGRAPRAFSMSVWLSTSGRWRGRDGKGGEREGRAAASCSAGPGRPQQAASPSLPSLQPASFLPPCSLLLLSYECVPFIRRRSSQLTHPWKWQWCLIVWLESYEISKKRKEFPAKIYACNGTKRRVNHTIREISNII